MKEELIKAAKLIRNFCDENGCKECPFYNHVNWHCGLQKMWPAIWEVEENEEK